MVIFPDGTGPALMSCMIAGIPFSDVHALEYDPGEIRLDITPESVMALYQKRKDDPAYLAAIEEGKVRLAELRQQRTIVGLKEQKAEQERLDMDAAYELRKTADAQKERERQQVVAKQKESQLRAEREAKRAQEQERREKQLQVQRDRTSRKISRVPTATNNDDGTVPGTVAGRVSSSNGGAVVGPDDYSPPKTMSVSSFFATAALGVAGLGFAAVGTAAGGGGSTAGPVGVGGDSNDPTDDKSPVVREDVPNESNERIVNGAANNGSATVITSMEGTAPPKMVPLMSSRKTTPTLGRTARSSIPAAGSLFDEPVPVRGDMTVNPIITGIDDTGNDDMEMDVSSPMFLDGETTEVGGARAVGGGGDNNDVIDNQLNQLAAAEQAMIDALSEASAMKRISADEEESSPLEARKGRDGRFFPDLMDEEEDGGGNDWLRALVEIRDGKYEDEDEDSDDVMELVINGAGGSYDGPSLKLDKNTTGWKN